MLAALIMIGLLVCEHEVAAAGYGGDKRLLTIVPAGEIIELEAAGKRYNLNIAPLRQIENLRREYYVFLPRSLRITEQAVNLCLKGLLLASEQLY